MSHQNISHNLISEAFSTGIKALIKLESSETNTFKDDILAPLKLMAELQSDTFWKWHFPLKGFLFQKDELCWSLSLCLSGYLQQYNIITETSEVREGRMAQGQGKAGPTLPAIHANTIYLLH